jgi:Outer membrane protein beta-barrel domain
MYPKDKPYLKLKRSLILSVFLIGVLITSANAQISIGAQTGVNLNQFTMPGSTIGVNVGAFGTYKFLPFLTAKLEINYSQEGGGRQNYFLPLNDPRLADIAGNISQLNYINPYVYIHNLQVPLLVELSLPEFAEASVMPKLILGGSYSYMLSANELHTKQFIFQNGTFADVPYLKEDVTSNYVASQFSLIAGMGIQFKGEKRDFSFDIRYRQGITQLNNVTESLSYKDGRLFSSTLSFNFSMTIFKF